MTPMEPEDVSAGRDDGAVGSTGQGFLLGGFGLDHVQGHPQRDPPVDHPPASDGLITVQWNRAGQ
ncbi:hypothetical protein [Nonomuraea sp. NPDC049141]|uniref:hypothetical protein n=1 Tax=unclassified Nonomuraea TaxID=2593643 RepID=UPI003402A5C7